MASLCVRADHQIPLTLHRIVYSGTTIFGIFGISGRRGAAGVSGKIVFEESYRDVAETILRKITSGMMFINRPRIKSSRSVDCKERSDTSNWSKFLCGKLESLRLSPKSTRMFFFIQRFLNPSLFIYLHKISCGSILISVHVHLNKNFHSLIT